VAEPQEEIFDNINSSKLTVGQQAKASISHQQKSVKKLKFTQFSVMYFFKLKLKSSSRFIVLV
jgi:hypothetical protein